jgi:hypothetical protein
MRNNYLQQTQQIIQIIIIRSIIIISKYFSRKIKTKQKNKKMFHKSDQFVKYFFLQNQSINNHCKSPILHHYRYNVAYNHKQK